MMPTASKSALVNTGAPQGAAPNGAARHLHGTDNLQFSSTAPDDVPVQIEFTRASSSLRSGIGHEWQNRPPICLLQGAIDAAKSADLTVAMVGLSPQIKGRGNADP